MMALIMICIGLLVLAVWLAFLVQGAPFVKTNDGDSQEILKIVKKYKPIRALDIGSGNGKLVILLAQNGFRVDGIELNPILVWLSRRQVKKLGIQNKATIRWGNFWKTDTSKYDLVTIYAIQHIMPKLEVKLSSGLKPGAIVISNYFTFPIKKPINKGNRIHVYKF